MEDNRPRYEVHCPICSRVFWACASILQIGFGELEMGSGNCPGCKTHLNLTLDIENKKMIPTEYEKWKMQKEEIHGNYAADANG